MGIYFYLRGLYLLAYSFCFIERQLAGVWHWERNSITKACSQTGSQIEREANVTIRSLKDRAQEAFARRRSLCRNDLRGQYLCICAAENDLRGQCHSRSLNCEVCISNSVRLQRVFTRSVSQSGQEKRHLRGECHSFDPFARAISQLPAYLRGMYL